jgi:hypothetical protein
MNDEAEKGELRTRFLDVQKLGTEYLGDGAGDPTWAMSTTRNEEDNGHHESATIYARTTGSQRMDPAKVAQMVEVLNGLATPSACWSAAC